MVKTVAERFLREQNLLSGNGIVAGLSGGADSVCLLLILRELAETYGFPVYAVHVNHGIRGEEADRDERFCMALCERIGVSLSCFLIDVPKEAAEKNLSVEEAGREARYRLLYEVAVKTGSDAVAVAHHRDDNAETVLYRLCRGTGIRGLSGIPSVSKPFGSDLRLVRPLLAVSREEILSELKERNETYCTDGTNLENDYARNLLRNEVFPLLERVHPGAAEHIAALAGHAELLTEFLHSETDRVYREAYSEGTLAASVLANVPEIVRREVLLKYIAEQSGARKDIGAQHVISAEELLTGPVSKELSLPYGVTLLRTYEGLTAKRREDSVESAGKSDGIEAFAAGIPLNEGAYVLPDGRKLLVSIRALVPGEKVCKKKWIKWLDYDMIKDAPVLRLRREGDFFYMNENGGRKLLREYFITGKFPKEKRDRTPVVAAGSEVLWIPGERGTERYRVTERTKRIWVFEIQQ